MLDSQGSADQALWLRITRTVKRLGVDSVENSGKHFIDRWFRSEESHTSTGRVENEMEVLGAADVTVRYQVPLRMSCCSVLVPLQRRYL